MPSEPYFAENLIREMEERLEGPLLARYIDYEAFARDLFLGDYVSLPNPGGGVFVFRRL